MLALAILGCTLAFAVPASVLAQPSVSIDTKVDRREVAPHGDITYEVNVTVEGNYQIDTTRQPGFGSFGVMGRSVEPSFRMHNFDAFRSLRLEYRLRAPGDSGEYTIGAPEFSVGDQSISADPVTIRVTGDPAPSPSVAPDQDTSEQPAFVNVSLRPDRDPYVGEQLFLQYELYINLNHRRLRARPPGEAPLDDFWIEDITEDIPRRRTREFVDGKHWNVTPLRAFALFPLRAGRATIESIDVPLVRASLFSHSNEMVVASQPVELDVQPLPEGAPEGFTSANVGSWDFDVDVDSRTARVGGGITITATVDGIGRPNRLGEPSFDPGPSFRLLSSDDDSTRTIRDNQLGGTRSFSYHLMPLEEGSLEVPAFTFSYFDPDKAEYITHRSEPIEVHIEPGDLPPERDIEASSRNSRDDSSATDAPLAHLHELLEPGSLSATSSRLPFSVWLLVIPLLGLLLLLIERPLSRPILRRLSPRFRRRQLQSQVEVVFDSDDAPVSTRCLRALRLCLNDGLGLSLGALTTDDVARATAQLDLSPELRDETTTLVDELVTHRYARNSASSDADFENRTRRLINALLNWRFASSAAPTSQTSTLVIFFALGLATIVASNAMLAAPAEASDIAFPDQDGDWYQALEYWSNLADDAPLDATLQFNAGTAAAHAGELGLSRLYLERAQVLDGRAKPVRENLRRVKSSLAAQNASVANFRQQTSLAITLHALAPWIVLIALWAALLIALVRRVSGWPQPRSIFVSMVTTGLVITIVASLIWWDVESFQRSTDPGVVISAEQTLRQAPSRHASAVTSDELPAGAVFRTIETRDGWTRLQLPTGQQGWLPDSSVAAIISE